MSSNPFGYKIALMPNIVWFIIALLLLMYIQSILPVQYADRIRFECFLLFFSLCRCSPVLLVCINVEGKIEIWENRLTSWCTHTSRTIHTHTQPQRQTITSTSLRVHLIHSHSPFSCLDLCVSATVYVWARFVQYAHDLESQNQRQEGAHNKNGILKYNRVVCYMAWFGAAVAGAMTTSFGR